MNLLLTGGTGFFGKALIKHWMYIHGSYSTKFNVTILSRNPDKFLAENEYLTKLNWLNVVRGDVTNSKSLPKEVNFSHIIHAATDSTIGPSMRASERLDQIISGTKNLLNFALETGAKKFLLTSSGGIYGQQPEEMSRITEEYLGAPNYLNPANAYSVGKRVAEHLALIYFQEYGLETVIARCFAFVGEDLPLNAHFAIGNFLGDALHGDSIVIKGDGLSVRSYMDQRDLAEWLDTMLIHGAGGQVYNVGSDRSITIIELANLIKEILKIDKPIIVLGGDDSRKSLRNIYVPSIEKAKKELGLRINFTLEESIRDVAIKKLEVHAK